ncbi:hypothetical protein O3M35_012200 [Rhynocoris fuscipes]|uniref:Uncharacterized protein n=1 Tax=Rhynocoris fuscipes TaxID=488301 RepID=A0AAW1CU37_9HEMI
MKTFVCLLATLAYVSASGVLLGAIPDDGQWRPWLDRSILGASPGLATAVLGAANAAVAPAIVAPGVIGAGVIAPGVVAAGHVIGKRSLGALAIAPVAAGVINPNALNVPLDTVTVAAAKNAQLISQATEGARNILGGGVPLALPADTPEVAIGKAAHAIAHDTEAARNALHGAVIGPAGIIGAGALLGHGIW